MRLKVTGLPVCIGRDYQFKNFESTSGILKEDFFFLNIIKKHMALNKENLISGVNVKCRNLQKKRPNLTTQESDGREN